MTAKQKRKGYIWIVVCPDGGMGWPYKTAKAAAGDAKAADKGCIVRLDCRDGGHRVVRYVRAPEGVQGDLLGEGR